MRLVTERFGFIPPTPRQLTSHRIGFAPRNNLDSKATPIFRPKTPPAPVDQESYHLSTSPCGTNDSSPELPSLSHCQRRSETVTSTVNGGKTLSELGDSSSLFFSESPVGYESVSSLSPYAEAHKSINFELKLLTKAQPQQARPQHQRNMVNERAPAKAPLRPVIPNEQPQSHVGAPPALPKSSQPPAPQFGQPSMQATQMNRPAQKESSVFVQPKSRPEHHRDAPKTCITHLSTFRSLLTVYSKFIQCAIKRSNENALYGSGPSACIPES